jgi:hypothetical protein
MRYIPLQWDDMKYEQREANKLASPSAAAHAPRNRTCKKEGKRNDEGKQNPMKSPFVEARRSQAKEPP